MGWKNSRPDSIFTFTEIENARNYITEFLGINIPFDYREDEKEYWNSLLTVISENYKDGFNWKSYIERRFNAIKFDLKKILEIWADDNYDAFDRWLLKNYLLYTNHIKDNPYFDLCIKKHFDYSVPTKLFVSIAESIFYSISESEIEKYHRERTSIMKRHKKLFQTHVPISSQEWIQQKIIERAQKEGQFAIAKKLCAGIFDFELELFMGWYAYKQDSEFGMKHLKEYYPDLHSYLSSTDNTIYQKGAEWLSQYFKVYREAKILDTYSDDVQGFISTKNANNEQFWDWYYKHNTCRNLFHEFMNDESRKPDKIYWVDGLGAEYIPFIQNIIKNAKGCKYEIIEAQVATTGLPSNTSLNSFEVDGKTIVKLGDLDSLAHSNHYRKRKTLISELSVVRNMIEKILHDNNIGYHTIAIVSDHGLSALSRLCEPHKITGEAHHEGRYIPYTTDVAAEPSQDYVTIKNHDDGKDYKVALTHSSLGKKPSHEVHGGCTPEEVLVPFIVITNNEVSKPIHYDYKVISSDLPLSSPKFECVIEPQPNSVEMLVGDKKIQMTVSNTTWMATIPDAKEGKLIVSILPDKGKIKNVEVTIFGLGMSSTLIDDDF